MYLSLYPLWSVYPRGGVEVSILRSLARPSKTPSPTQCGDRSTHLTHPLSPRPTPGASADRVTVPYIYWGVPSTPKKRPSSFGKSLERG